MKLPMLNDASALGQYEVANTGGTANGWSKVETFILCPQKYAFRYLLPFDGKPPADALVRGSIAHAGWAHLYERIRRKQQGDTRPLKSPEEAIHLVAREFRDQGVEDIRAIEQLVLEGMAAYQKAYPFDELNYEILYVEVLVEHNVLGHPFSARIDLIVRPRITKMIEIWDHKSTNGALGVQQYQLSGSMLSKYLFGKAKFGADFAGVVINQLSWRDFKVDRFPLDPQPNRLARWGRDYAFWRGQMKALEDAGTDPYAYPGAISEQICDSKYEHPCSFAERCRWGR